MAGEGPVQIRLVAGRDPWTPWKGQGCQLLSSLALGDTRHEMIRETVRAASEAEEACGGMPEEPEGTDSEGEVGDSVDVVTGRADIRAGDEGEN